MTREQLIKARDGMPSQETYNTRLLSDQWVHRNYNLIRTLINNALDEPIEGLAEAIKDVAVYLKPFTEPPSHNRKQLNKVLKAARRQLNQGETK